MRRAAVLWFCLGTAGELIKIYPVLRAADRRNIPWWALATGQSPVNLVNQWKDFRLPEDRLRFLLETQCDLRTSGAAFRWFSRANWVARKGWLEHRIEALVGTRVKPDDVWMVHGDTLSTVVGARYARALNVSLAHLEAGLRSPRLFSPFPEEINRRMVSRWASIHLPQDEMAEKNLKQSGVKGRIATTQANTLLDTIHEVLENFPKPELPKQPYVVANLHRFENLNSSRKWGILVNALLRASECYPVYFVLHPPTIAKLEAEPETRKRLEDAGVCLEKRQPFTRFIHLLNGAEFVLSDGGSNQEECFYLGKPCLLLRDATERKEGLESTCLLSFFDEDRINRFFADPRSFARPEVTRKVSPSEVVLNAVFA